jgi:hypothetical protein
MSRFYESFPLRTDHTVPNLVAHITTSLTFIIELSSPSHAAFGLLGFTQPPTVASSSNPPIPPSKTALKKVARKGKQGKQRDQHSALLAYMAEQGIAVPPHLAAGALTIPPARPTIPPPPGPRTSMVAPTPGHHYCFVHGWTTSHGWKAGKWAGALCRTLHAVPSPYSTQQVRPNSQDPSLGGNVNVYVVRGAPSHLPLRVSPLTACSLRLPPGTPRENRTKTFLPSLTSTSLPNTFIPHSSASIPHSDPVKQYCAPMGPTAEAPLLSPLPLSAFHPPGFAFLSPPYPASIPLPLVPQPWYYPLTSMSASNDFSRLFPLWSYDAFGWPPSP